MSAKEEKRARVLTSVLDHRCTGKQAARLLGMSERHLWRLVAAYRAEGPAALVHGNRGLRPSNAMAEDVRQKLLALAEGKYAGFNDCHLAEVLEEREGLQVPRSTLQRLLRQAGRKSPKHRRAPRHRSRRERYPQEGLLIQIDGSPHAWLEERGPRLTLLGGIDDATGTVPYALFREQEDAHGYFLLLEGIVQRKGIPAALYCDRHGVFVHATKEKETLDEMLAGGRPPTQFADAMRRLDIQLVIARSPQAKGRVERLWGTLQSRLVSELRLAGATTLEEANAVLRRYLPVFNARFGVPPADGRSGYRGSAGVDLESTLCFRYYRRVAKDNTVVWRDRVLQIGPGKDRISYAKAVVELQERLDGRVVLLYKGTPLGVHAAPAGTATLRPDRHRGLGLEDHRGTKVDLPREGRSREEREVQGLGGEGTGLSSEARHVVVAKSTAHPPKPDHPWRKRLLTKSLSN